MGSKPKKISIITPTWNRHELLLTRCLPSVQEQDYPAVEHVIISDGPDENLRDFLAVVRKTRHPVRYAELPAHDPGMDHDSPPARLAGLELAAGDYVTYCDDDDALRPEHCRLMAEALDDNPDAGFAVSRMMCHTPAGKSVIGWGKLECGNVGTPMICHRRELAAVATWRDAGLFPDWDLVERWLAAGVRFTDVSAETSDVFPARFWEVP
jgi:glycosyltransferase involved in cell wall biosynthesis